MAHRAPTVRALNSHTVLETIRIELLHPHMAAVTWVTCEAQWQAADIKVFISFLTIYNLFSMTDFTTSIFHNNKGPAFSVRAASECRRCAGEHIGEWRLGGRKDCRNHARHTMPLCCLL